MDLPTGILYLYTNVFGWMTFGMLLCTPAIIGAFLGAGLHPGPGSPLYTLMSGHGLPADLHGLALALWSGVSLLVGYLAYLRNAVILGFLFWPVLLVVFVIGFIFGWIYVESVMYHAGMSMAVTFLLSCYFLTGWVANKLLAFNLAYRSLKAAEWIEKMFNFAFPLFLCTGTIGAGVHWKGEGPIYKSLAEHGIPGKYHAAVLVALLAIPSLAGVLFVRFHRSGRNAIEAYILMASGALAGYAVGSLIGDMVKYHYGWIVTGYKVTSMLLLANFADQWLGRFEFKML